LTLAKQLEEITAIDTGISTISPQHREERAYRGRGGGNLKEGK